MNGSMKNREYTYSLNGIGALGTKLKKAQYDMLMTSVTGRTILAEKRCINLGTT